MTTFIISSNGSAIDKKSYTKLLFEKHSDEAEWLITSFSTVKHFVIPLSGMSSSICNKTFNTLDLHDFNIDSYRPCKICQRLLDKE